MADPFDLMEDHAKLIGSVVIAYNRVQSLLAVLFVAFSDMPAEQAKGAFFSIKSDRGQRDAALAASTTALAEHPVLLERFKAAIEKLKELANERNAAVHTNVGR